jgi:hypothetical protein
LMSLEEFRKSPHIKIPPKSPCTNFQSLGIFKNPIFILKEIFLQLSAQQPADPSGLLAHSPQLAFFFLLLHRSRASKPAPPASIALPRWSAPTTSTKGKKSPHHPSFIPPLNDTLSTLQSSRNRCLQTESIEGPSTPAIEGTWPPPPRLCPIKAAPPKVNNPTPPTLLLLALTAPTPSPF